MTTTEPDAKADVHDFWNEGSCGEAYAHGDDERARYAEQARARYELEPYIHGFAKFSEAPGHDVLEIGVGMGADHEQWAKAGAQSLTGVDLTERAVEHTRNRLGLLNLSSELQVADAENLPFDDEQFDIVYSWGVLHHSPNTQRAIDEVYRVLRPGGTARIMIYNKWSMTGAMLWTRYAMMRGRPWRGFTHIYANHLESPNTKAYTPEQAARLFGRFSSMNHQIELAVSDLIEGVAGQRHQGRLLDTARRLWPRDQIRRHLPNRGLFLMIEAVR